jgi:hypothetical protein
MLGKRARISELSNIQLLLEATLNSGALSMNENGFVLASSITIKTEIPIHIITPYISINVGIDGMDAVSAEVTGMRVQEGTLDLASVTEISFGKSDTLPPILAEMVKHAVDDTFLDFDREIIIQGIKYGASKEDSSFITSYLDLPIPGYALKLIRDRLLPKEGEDPVEPIKPVEPTLLDRFKFNLPFDLGDLSLQSFMPQLTGLDVVSSEGQHISSTVDVSFRNPLSFTVDIPHLEVALLADSNEMIFISVQGIAAATGDNTQTVVVSTRFGNEVAVQDSVGRLVTSLLDNTGFWGVRLSMKEISLGLDAGRAVKVFSKVEADIPEEVMDLDGESILSSISPWIKSFSIEQMTAEITAIDVDVSISNGMILGLSSASFNNPLPISIDIGFFSFSIMLGESVLVDIEAPRLVVSRGRQVLDLSATVKFGDEASLADPIKSFIQALVSGKGFDRSNTTVSMIGMAFGVSRSDGIRTFSRAPLKVPIPSIYQLMSMKTRLADRGFEVLSLVPWINRLTLDTIKPTLRSLDVRTVSGGMFVSIATNLNNPSPVKLSIGHSCSRIYLGGSQFLTITLSELNLYRGEQTLSLGVELKFSKGESVEVAIMKFIKDVLIDGIGFELPDSPLTISGVEFGKSPTDRIGHFSLMELPIPIPPNIGSYLLGGDGQSFGKFAEFLPWVQEISLNSFKSNIQTCDLAVISGGVKFEIAGTFKNPAPISLDVGHASARISLGGSEFVDLVLSGVHLSRSEGPQDIEIAVIAKFGSGEVLESAVSQLVKDVIERKGVEFSNSPLSVIGFDFGVSSTDKISIFNDLGLPLPLHRGLFVVP